MMTNTATAWQVEQQTIRNNARQEFVEHMQAMKAAKVVANFYGSGDSGGIESYTLYDWHNSQIETPPMHERQREKFDYVLEVLVDEFVDYNNEGSIATLTARLDPQHQGGMVGQVEVQFYETVLTDPEYHSI